MESAFATGFWHDIAGRHLALVANPQPKKGLEHSRWILGHGAFLVGVGCIGAIPFWLIPSLNLSGAASVFESISGLTTTGATVITGLDALPQSLLLYRQLLQWLGGIGIVVLAVAVLPDAGYWGYAAVSR